LAYVRIEKNGLVVYGEASLPPYYKETFASVEAWVLSQNERVRALLENDTFPIEDEIPFSPEHPAASAALQSALLYWYVNFKEEGLSDHFIQEENEPGLSLTLTKWDLGSLEEKLQGAEDFSHLKLKLTGGSDDLEFVRSVLKKTSMPFCVDLNQGCADKEAALTLAEELASMHCVLMEQPLKSHDHEGHHWLKQRTALPIIADESICQYEDLVQYHQAYSGVNVKLMKCGGLYQAQGMLQWKGVDDEFIRAIGCMAESSLGVATASVLASQCSLADLDAPYLVKNDPFIGFKIEKKKIVTAEKILLIKGRTNF